MEKIDLHIHTVASDGKLTCDEIIDMAAKKHVDCLSITDHDSVESVTRAIDYGNEKGISVIPGIEFSVEWKATVHILGYYIDINNKGIVDACKKIQNSRMTELIQLIKKLRQLGIQIDIMDIKKQRLDGIKSIANYMLQHGYGNSTDEILNRYLRREGLAYVTRHGLSDKEAISIIKNAGGVAILAHPGRIKVAENELFRYIDELVDYGLDGIEVYSQHNKKVNIFEKYCLDRKLLISGGSDFHDSHLEEIGKYKGIDIPYKKVYKSICDIG